MKFGKVELVVGDETPSIVILPLFELVSEPPKYLLPDDDFSILIY